MKTITLTTYWAREQLQSELAMIKAMGHNAYRMMILDIDNFKAGDDSPWLAEIERQFAYLEAGLIEQTCGWGKLHGLKRYPAFKHLDEKGEFAIWTNGE